MNVLCRRAPEFKFPTAYDDSFKGLEWLQSEKATASLPLNVDFSRVFLCGDSAGANIAYHMALQSARKDLGRVSLKGVVIIQGFFGGEERTPAELRLKNVPLVSVESLDWYWKSYLPKGSNRDHPACNIFGPNSSDLSDVSLPPFLNIVGGLDILQDWEVSNFSLLFFSTQLCLQISSACNFTCDELRNGRSSMIVMSTCYN